MTLKEFIYDVHCENDRPSSKRFYGGIGYITVQLCVIAATILSLVKTGMLSETVHSLLDIDLITSASLIGLNTIMRTVKGVTTSIGEKKENLEGNDREKE